MKYLVSKVHRTEGCDLLFVLPLPISSLLEDFEDIRKRLDDLDKLFARRATMSPYCIEFRHHLEFSWDPLNRQQIQGFYKDNDDFDFGSGEKLDSRYEHPDWVITEDMGWCDGPPLETEGIYYTVTDCGVFWGSREGWDEEEFETPSLTWKDIELLKRRP